MKMKTDDTFLDRLRASAWLALVARAVAVAAGLLALAWVGRTADASGTAAAPPDDAAAVADAAPPIAPAALPAPAASPPPRSGPRGRATADDPVFLNEADEDELRRLPGVGAKRADAILALRRRVGRFKRVEELMRVKGIGRATVRRWRTLVRLDAPRPAGDAGAP